MNWLLGNVENRDDAIERTTTPDADELRRRRLAKLEEAEAAEKARRKEFEERKAKWEASKKAASASSQPAESSGAASSDCAVPKPSPSSSEAKGSAYSVPNITDVPSRAVPRPEHPEPKRLATAMPSVEVLVSRVLSRIFAIAVESRLASSDMIFNQSLIDQLRDDSKLSAEKPLLLDPDSHADDILLNRINNDPAPFKFLFSCFERCDQQRSEVNSNKRLQGAEQDSRRSTLHRAISDVQQRVLTYTGMLLMGLFMDVEASSPQAFARYVLNEEVPAGFIRALLNRHSLPDASLEDILPSFRSVFMFIRSAIEADSKLGSTAFLKPLNALNMLVSYKELCKLITSDDCFCPDISKDARTALSNFQKSSYLTPFFAMSALPGVPIGTIPSFPEDPSIGPSMFPNPSMLGRAEAENAIYSLRSSLSVARNLLSQICLSLCKAGTEPRNMTLSWFASIFNLNKKRAGMQPDPRVTSRDGFMMNIMFVLLKLCDPIVSGGWKMLQKVDPTFPQSTHRIDYTDETRLAADTNMLKRWWVDQRNENAQKSLVRQLEGAARESGMSSDGAGSDSMDVIQVPTEFNFISECFWLALRGIQLGFSALAHVYDEEILRLLHRIRDIVKKMEAAKESGTLPIHQEPQLVLFKRRFDILLQTKLCYDVYLHDKELLTLLVRFVTADAEWIMKKLLVNSKGHAALPLPTPVDPTFASLPEHTVEMITTVLLTTMRIDQGVVMDHSTLLEELVSFCVVGSASPLHIKNPYLRAKLIEFLSMIFPRFGTMIDGEEEENHFPSPDPAMVTLFSSHQLSRKFLPGALFRLYVDVEHTGSHTQFYDKFSIRYRIGSILESLWSIPDYRKSVRDEARDESRFLRFVNMVLNDAIHLMDSVLDDLEEMRSLEVLIQNKGPEWEALSEEEKQEKQDRLQKLEGSAKSYNQIANSNVKLLWLLTQDDVVRRVFLRDEMVSRLAEMLNYLLERLCGQRCNDLKVSDPSKVSWRPRQLLKRIIDIYVHFKNEEKFAVAVAKDGRSYKAELFTRAIGIIKKRRVLASSTVDSFEEVAEAAAKAHEAENQEEENLGEIPDEFLDPIMSVLMRNPVRLPTSGNVMDRAVISRILLSDKVDPFNREFLTEDMLIEDVDLKKRIDTFVAEKRASRGASSTGLQE